MYGLVGSTVGACSASVEIGVLDGRFWTTLLAPDFATLPSARSRNAEVYRSY